MRDTIKYERDGQWMTIDQVRKYNAEKIRKQIKETGNKEGTQGKEEDGVCVRDIKKGRVEIKKKKDKKVIEIEAGKGNETDDVFIDEETDAPEPTLEEIRSKK